MFYAIHNEYFFSLLSEAGSGSNTCKHHHAKTCQLLNKKQKIQNMFLCCSSNEIINTHILWKYCDKTYSSYIGLFMSFEASQSYSALSLNHDIFDDSLVFSAVYT